MPIVEAVDVILILANSVTFWGNAEARALDFHPRVEFEGMVFLCNWSFGTPLIHRCRILGSIYSAYHPLGRSQLSRSLAGHVHIETTDSHD